MIPKLGVSGWCMGGVDFRDAGLERNGEPVRFTVAGFAIIALPLPRQTRDREPASSDEVFEDLAEIFEALVVLLLGERVPGCDEQSDRPFDDLERDECCHGTVEGELLRCWETNRSDERQVDGKSLGWIESALVSPFGQLFTDGRNSLRFAVCCR